MLSCFCQVIHVHHVISIDFLCSSCHNIRIVNILHSWHLRSNSNVLLSVHFIFFPINLKFGYSWFFNKNMSRELGNIWDIWWIFNQLWKFIRICIVDVISNSEKFLVVVIRACEQNGCDTNNVVCLKFCYIWRMTLVYNKKWLMSLMKHN